LVKFEDFLMSSFNRIYSITISPNLLIENLKIKFEIKKSLETKNNYSKIDIYNLSQKDRNAISSEQYALFKMKCGYSEDQGLINIAQGNVSDVIHSTSVPDIVTTIYSKDGFSAIKNNYIQLSFSENTSIQTIADKIIQKMNLPVRFSNLKNQTIKNGYSFIGTVSEALNDLGNQYDFDWSIQNGEIQILTKNSSTNFQAFLLSPETGLIENPTRTIKNKYFEKKGKGEYSVTSLLNPQLEVGDLVSVDSNALKGNFLIKEITHTGDTRGNEWYSRLIITDR
jgi:hypothetical protein